MTYTHEQIAALLAAITQGEWSWVNHRIGGHNTLENSQGVVIIDDGSAGGEYSPVIIQNTPNAEFIAAAPDIVAQLLAENARLRAFAQQQIDRYVNTRDAWNSMKPQDRDPEGFAVFLRQSVAEDAQRALRESEATDD